VATVIVVLGVSAGARSWTRRPRPCSSRADHTDTRHAAAGSAEDVTDVVVGAADHRIDIGLVDVHVVV